jgi:hypothetical protein
MPSELTVNTISGTSPYNVYICDDPITTCFYIATITDLDLPYVFTAPSIMNTLTSFNVKIIDDNNCMAIENVIPTII